MSTVPNVLTVHFDRVLSKERMAPDIVKRGVASIERCSHEQDKRDCLVPQPDLVVRGVGKPVPQPGPVSFDRVQHLSSAG